MSDLVVVGSGIAGLSAALTAARLGLETVLLTGDNLGGQLLSIAKVDGYPGFPDGVAGYDLCPMAQEQAVAAGASLRATEAHSLERAGTAWRIACGDGAVLEARGVILATGAALKTLGVPGEAELAGKGVSHCASCDAALLRGKIAVVVGGGDSALQEALTLAAAAARVVILHRGARASAQQAYREAAAAAANIEFRWHTDLTAILGSSAVESVRMRGAAGAEEEIAAHGVFVYVGLAPRGALAAPLGVLDAAGAIVTDAAMRTALPGLAAAGAVRAGWPGRAAAASGEGAAAAVAIARALGDDGGRQQR